MNYSKNTPKKKSKDDQHCNKTFFNVSKERNILSTKIGLWKSRYNCILNLYCRSLTVWRRNANDMEMFEELEENKQFQQ